MKWFYNLKISVKLISSFIIVALIAGIVGAVGIANIKKINDQDTELYENMTVPIAQMASVATSFQRIRVDTRDIILANTYEDIVAQEESIKLRRAEIDTNAAEFEKTILSEEVRAAYNEFLDARKEYTPHLEQLVLLAKENKDVEANALLSGDMAKSATAEQEVIEKLVKLKVAGAAEKSGANDRAAKTATTTMIIIIAGGILLAVGIGIFISQIISKPISKMVGVANKVADGDVNVDVQADTKDEIGSLAEAFGKMIESIRGQAMAAERIAAGDLTIEVSIKSENDLLGKKLSEMVEKNNEILNNISAASEQVAAGAKQVSDSSIALSQGATEQASSVEELTASLEEISAQTKHNAENASEANVIAETAKANAAQGNSQMKDMLKAMDEINDSSSSISKIIKVIDEIAFQTNILALNAAVEAARAGQHGKGFAVVAEEVRNLAARSANAAKETTDMIEGSIKKVEGGTKIAIQTADALNKIVEGVAKVASLVGNIAIASNEQASGIEQINQGIMQVSQVIQSNSATSEESAAASEELSSQAQMLKEEVARFKLKKTNRSTYRGMEDLNPEVLKMLEDMNNKKRQSTKSDAFEEAAASSSKRIALSDREFGKY